MDIGNIKNTCRQLLRCPVEFYVEALLGLTFFGFDAWATEANLCIVDAVGTHPARVNDDILALFVPLMVLTFFLHRVNRWAYRASYFLFLPLMMLNLKPFIGSTAYAFTFVLAAILLVVGHRRLSNRPFAAHLLHVVTQMFFGLLISGLLTAAVMSIFYSFCYIFGIDDTHLVEMHLLQFIWYVIAPLMCCFFVSRGEYTQDDGLEEDNILGKPMRIILNGILSPAVIIYTVILYVYFIKIALAWDLPKGGVAYMVMGFITAALAGKLTQYILPRRYYDWFYNHFTWIAIPPLVMFWVGSFYRIRLYSFTEGRFYLLIAGGLMSLFVLMLLWKRTRRFQLMALIFGLAIIVFTYIPGISAKAVGIRSQTARLEGFIRELPLTDKATGKFLKHIDREAIKKDSVLLKQYQEVDDVVGYLSRAMPDSAFEKRYGEWPLDGIRYYRYSSDYVDNETVYRLETPVALGAYTLLLPGTTYEMVGNDSMIKVKRGGQMLLEYNVVDSIRRHPDWLSSPQRLHAVSNDSLLLVIPMICISDDEGVRVERHGAGASLYRRQ